MNLEDTGRKTRDRNTQAVARIRVHRPRWLCCADTRDANLWEPESSRGEARRAGRGRTCDVRLREVDDVNVVPDRRAVACAVVVAKHHQFRPDACRDLHACNTIRGLHHHASAPPDAPPREVSAPSIPGSLHADAKPARYSGAHRHLPCMHSVYVCIHSALPLPESPPS